jgi:hypothetical protein
MVSPEPRHSRSSPELPKPHERLGLRISIFMAVLGVVGLIWNFVTPFWPRHSADPLPKPTANLVAIASPTPAISPTPAFSPTPRPSPTPVTQPATEDAAPLAGVWSGDIEVPDSAGVDLDATPAFVDKQDPQRNANDIIYVSDHFGWGSNFGHVAPFLKFLGSTEAAKWTDAAVPREDQCRQAVDERADDGIFVEKDYQLCVRTYPGEGRVRYTVLRVTRVGDSIVLHVTRGPEATFDPGRSGWGMFWLTLVTFVLVCLACLAAGGMESPWPAVLAVAVAVVWLILIWSSMAGWLIVLLLVLMFVAGFGSAAAGAEMN